MKCLSHCHLNLESKHVDCSLTLKKLSECVRSHRHLLSSISRGLKLHKKHAARSKSEGPYSACTDSDDKQVQVYCSERLLACHPYFATPPERHSCKLESLFIDASNTIRSAQPHHFGGPFSAQASLAHKTMNAGDLNSPERASSLNPFLHRRPHFLKSRASNTRAPDHDFHVRME